MLKNYLLTTYRCFARTKILSLINIMGLALGMTACLLILDYANYEKSYDRFHENADRIYRLRYERTDESGSSARFASCCPPAAARIRGNYPEVEQIGRLLKTQAIVSHENTKFLEERIFYAEPEFLDILRFSFIEGDPLTGLREPTNAYISQTTAIKYFGDQNPIGKTLTTDGKNDYIIAGVFEDIPHNSHIKFDILLPWEKLAILAGPDYTEAWGHTGSYTYLRVSPGTDPREFERNLLPLIESECPWLKDYKMTMTLPMQPLTDIHLTSHFMQEYEANGDLGSINTLYIVAFFIMTMAWVNFVNLGTARSINRAREVGLRKVVGASLKQVRAQFFIEIGLTNLMAAVGAIGLVALSLPYFYQIAGIPAEHVIWLQPWFWIAIGLMLLAGVFLSGLYPIIAMSSFEPITALRNRLQRSARGVNLRKVLVVFQFAVGWYW